MRIQLCLILASTLSLTACNGVGNSASGTNSYQSVQEVSANMNQIKAQVSSAQTSLGNAQTALSSIFTSSGGFNWTIFLGGVNFSNLGASTQTCLQNAFPTSNIALLVLTAPSDIATALQCITSDVITVAGIANTDLTNAMSVLNSSLASVAAGSDQAIEIQSMITEVQALQTEYNTTMKALGSQLSVVTAFLKTLPTLTTGLIPVPILNMFVGMTVDSFVEPIVTVITQFQTQLEAL